MKSFRAGRLVIYAVVFALLAVIAVVVPFTLISFQNAGVVSYSSLHYDTVVESNGDIAITQKVTAVLPERSDDNDDPVSYHQLYQQYVLDPSQFDDITDISVADPSGRYYQQTDDFSYPSYSNSYVDSQWDQDSAYRWYLNRNVGKNSAGKQLVEVGWNIPSTTSSSGLTFTITMTFTNATTKHPDVAEFKWEPVGDSNETPITNLTGTVHFPEGIDKANSWAWLHFAGDSTTSRASDGSLEYSIPYVPPKTHVDLRAMFDSSVSSAPRTNSEPAKQSVIADETKQEKAWYDLQHTQAVERLIVWILSAAVIVILAVWALIMAFRTHRRSQYHGNLDYFRDLPPVSPAAAAKLIDIIMRGTLPQDRSGDPNALTATILSLASKKAIALLPGSVDMYAGEFSDGQFTLNDLLAASGRNRPANDQGTTVVMLEQFKTGATSQSFDLSPSERAALEFLKFVSQQVGSPYFDFDQANATFKNLARSVSNQSIAIEAVNRISAIQSSARGELDATQSLKRTSFGRNCAWVLLLLSSLAAGVGYSVTGQVFIGLVLGVFGALIAAFSKVWGSDFALSTTGQDLAGKVLGLRNYLLAFSNFKDRGVDDLILWDRYLVYAAAFGISKEVADQLALAVPQVQDSQWLYSNYNMYPLLFISYHSWGWNNNGFGTGVPGTVAFNPNFLPNSGIANFGNQIQANIHSIQQTVTMASHRSQSSGGFGGSGGGFSSGGFRGSGGGFGGGSFGAR